MMDLGVVAGLKQVTPPSTEPVSVDDARLFIKRSDTSEDDTIETLIEGARSQVEGDTGQHLATQVWELALNALPCERFIELPWSPVQSVESVKTYDVSDVESTWAASNYYVDTYSSPARLVLRSAVAWPTNLRPYVAMVIRVKTGYLVQPPWAATAVLLRIAALSEHREMFDGEQRLYDWLIPRRVILA